MNFNNNIKKPTKSATVNGFVNDMQNSSAEALVSLIGTMPKRPGKEQRKAIIRKMFTRLHLQEKFKQQNIV